MHPAGTDNSRAAEAVADEPSRAYANYVLAVLVLVYVFNFIDRQILAILLQPIKDDLGVSDTAMGFLTGLAFALFYTLAGIPIARLADGGTRRTVIAVGVAVWSAMTAASGLARSFAQLAAARVGVGVGEAAASPAANSLISDYFPPERRATALAIYNMGANVGIMFGFFAGAWIGESLGWRAAFALVGLLGAFTTFSTFSIETLTLMQDALYLRAVLNILISVIACIGAAMLGVVLARQVG